MIRFNDVSASYLAQKSEIDDAILEVVNRGDFIGGKAIGNFETNFASYTGSAACAGVSSGTAALHLAMLAAGIGPGDEVITTPMTFIATSEAITLCGAKPVFADIDASTLNLDPKAVEQAITPATKAVLFVHLHGNPGGAAEVSGIAEKHDILFFEDCAQAHGARLADGKHVGNLGAAAAYSFFPAKNLGAFGDAGAITSTNAGLVTRARQLANHGRSEKYLHQLEGTNARIDTLQARILDVKLTKLDDYVVQRNAIASRYLDELKDLPLRFQPAPSGCRHAWHLFTVRTSQRDELQAFLKSKEVETGIHYPVPLHRQPAYEAMNLASGSFLVAENTAAETLSLPMYPQLSMQEVDTVIHHIRSFFK